MMRVPDSVRMIIVYREDKIMSTAVIIELLTKGDIFEAYVNTIMCLSYVILDYICERR